MKCSADYGILCEITAAENRTHIKWPRRYIYTRIICTFLESGDTEYTGTQHIHVHVHVHVVI